MHRFYAPFESFSAGTVVLGTDEARHLRDVLRMTNGDVIQVFDGEGGEYRCVVESVQRASARATVIESIEASAPESPLCMTLASAMLKGDKFDLVIQKAVELGVSEIVAMKTDRCDIRTKGLDSRIGRWQRIALEATKQCGRAKLTSVGVAGGIAELIQSSGGTALVLFSEREGVEMHSVEFGQAVTAITGPEGGWSDAELEIARVNHVPIITLGGRILRAETAAIAITTILQNRLGDVN